MSSARYTTKILVHSVPVYGPMDIEDAPGNWMTIYNGSHLDEATEAAVLASQFYVNVKLVEYSTTERLIEF